MNNAEIFRRAADYIREHGWCQGGFYNDAGGVCLEGAMAKAMDLELVSPCQVKAGAGFYSAPAMRRLYLRVADVVPAGMAKWNDAPGRTDAEVIALLDSLADDEELKDQIASLPPAVKEALPVGEGVKSGKISRR